MPRFRFHLSLSSSNYPINLHTLSFAGAASRSLSLSLLVFPTGTHGMYTLCLTSGYKSKKDFYGGCRRRLQTVRWPFYCQSLRLFRPLLLHFCSHCSLATLQLAVDSIVLILTPSRTYTHTRTRCCEKVYANAINYILL